MAQAQEKPVVEPSEEELEEYPWPWIEEARARDAEATKDMTPSEKTAYYRRMAAEVRRRWEEEQSK